jgi:aminopeptidase N
MKSIFLLLLFLLPIKGKAQLDPSLDQIAIVDFKTVNADVAVYPSEKVVKGKVMFNFDILKNTDSIYIDAKNMEFGSVSINGKPVKFFADQKRLWLVFQFSPSKNNVLTLNFSAKPKQAIYFINWGISTEIDVPRQVWTQGQGKYTSHWLPSFDDPREKAIFNLSVAFNKNYEVIANGELKDKTDVNDSVQKWNYYMEKPMSSYLLALATGNFQKKEISSASGIPIFLYYDLKNKEKVEPTYRYTKEIFDFLEKEIAFAYPWKNYKQVPVQDFLYAGMENTATTIFAKSLVVDSIGYNDRNYVSVNAHELAHQWFGNLVTAKTGEHHWLQEGFSTYYALLAEKEIFGDDYFYWKLFQSAEELKALSDNGKGESLLNSKASSLTFYQKGAWALHILREKVGEKAFKEAIVNYLTNNSFGSVSTKDFISEVEKAFGKDLKEFENDWLRQTAFQGTEALEALKKSEFIKQYMELAALREVPLQNKRELLDKVLTFPVNDYLGQEAVYQLAGENNSAIDLYKKAFRSNNLYVRQAIAMSVEAIPQILKPDFETLLSDASYVTIENALLKLWSQYPEETKKWLEKTKEIEGFSNKNVKILWLVINLVSPVENKEKISEYYEKLSSYTREYEPFELRQNAFSYLYQINAFSDQNLIDMVKAGQHYNTRFRDYARELLTKLLQKEEYRQRFLDLQPELEEQDLKFLKTRLTK